MLMLPNSVPVVGKAKHAVSEQGSNEGKGHQKANEEDVWPMESCVSKEANRPANYHEYK